MIERAVEDRRIKKIKTTPNNRKNLRRCEDIANIRAYYSVLGLCFGSLFIIGLISFIWGK